MTDFSHFDPAVPQALRERVQEFAVKIKEDLLTGSFRESLGDTTIERIYGIYLSGWVPFQEGGYCVNSLYRYGEDPCYHFTAKQTEKAHAVAATEERDFRKENGIAPDERLTDEQQEALFYMLEGPDGPLEYAEVTLDVSVSLRTDETRNKANGVYIHLYVEYLGIKETLFDERYSLKEFMTTDLDSIVEKVKRYDEKV